MAVFLILIAATFLYAGGMLIGFLQNHVEVGIALRWTGLVLCLHYTVRHRSLLLWTLIAMVVGAELGKDAPHFAAHTRILGEIFLRLIRMIVAPLIFGGIVTGIAGHGELKGVGRVALKSIAFFEVVTTTGAVLGALAIDISRAGVSVVLPTTIRPSVHPVQPTGWQDALVNVFPENIAQAVAQNQILQVAVFAVLFGVALAMLPQPRRAPLVDMLQSLTDTMFQLTKIVMYMAPFAAGAALAYTVATMGLQTLLPLMKLVATYYIALFAFVLLVLLPALAVARVPLRRFAVAVAEPTALAFATTTSEAALPLAMESMEEFGVPRWIVSFVIPVGYSFNMTGSSLYLSTAAIFAAQAAGIHLSPGQQIAMLATLLLTSKGVAGVPRSVLVILLATAASLHIPSIAVMMILGVDTLMDMGRTAMNVLGNCLASAVVARWEGELNTEASLAPDS